jgi:hypothetical protein
VVDVEKESGKEEKKKGREHFDVLRPLDQL